MASGKASFFKETQIVNPGQEGISGWDISALFETATYQVFQGRSPQICTVRHSVTWKNHKLNPLSWRKANKSLVSICTKDHKKHRGPPPRPCLNGWEIVTFLGMSHCDAGFWKPCKSPLKLKMLSVKYTKSSYTGYKCIKHISHIALFISKKIVGSKKFL